MNLKFKIIYILLFAVLFILILNGKALAASISVSAPGSVAPGNSFNVTVTGNDAIGKFGINVSGGSANTSSVWVEGNVSFSVTAGSSGSVRISVTAIDASDSKGNAVSPSGSATVQITGGTSSSPSVTTKPTNVPQPSNSTGMGGTTDTKPKFTNLGITPYTYDFHNFRSTDPSGTTYTANVPNEVTSITIYASTNGGSLSGIGAKTLKEGSNKFKISNGSIYYYINVVRATADGDEPPNNPDEEIPEETEKTGIRLESLKIDGYELDKEFDSEIFEYVVKIKEPITLDELNKIKEKIEATVNAEGVNYTVVAEISEEGVATIKIIVADDEKEYSRYVITFEVEEEKKNDSALGVVIPSSNNSNGTPVIGMFGLTEEQQIYAILASFGITFFIAMIFAIVSYVQHRKILDYEYDYDEEDVEGPEELQYNNSEFGKMNQYYNDVETPIDNEKSVSLENDNDTSYVEKAVDYERKLFKSRGLQTGRKGGKHF